MGICDCGLYILPDLVKSAMIVNGDEWTLDMAMQKEIDILNEKE